MNVNLISLESSAICSSAALLRYQDGSPQVTEKVSDSNQGHAEQLLPMIEQLLSEASLARSDIHGVVFGQGPGGFTGLRIAAGMAQGLGLGLDIPVFPVSSLLAVAEAVRPVAPFTRIVSVLDARMQEVFLAGFRETGRPELEIFQTPCLVSAEQVPLWLGDVQGRASGGDAAVSTQTPAGQPIVVVGSGINVNADIAALVGTRCYPDVQPHAGVMARIGLRAWLDGRFIPADQAAPLYVRDKVAFTTQERAHGQGGNPRATPLLTQSDPGQEAQGDTGSPAARTRRHCIETLQQTHQIRPMTEADIDAVVRIECAVQSLPWTVGNFRDALKAGYEAWVVCHGQQVIAFSLQLMAPDVAHLLLIGVRPDWQGNGIGTGLLAWGENQLLQRQLQAQVLEVRPSNTGAIAFYRRWGYEQIGVRKGYYPAGRGQSEDALVLQKAVVS